jgi:uncharacterized protein YgiM (DUF1202 family)
MTNKTIAAALSLGVLMSASFASAEVTSTANFSRGNTIVITDTINVRSGPNGSVIGTQQRGAKGTLVGGPINGGGYTWWNVNYTNGVDGWSAEDFMQQATVALVPTTPAGNSQVAAVVTAAPSSETAIQELLAQAQALLAQLQVLKASQTASAASSQ